MQQDRGQVMFTKIYHDHKAAEEAYREILSKGYNREDIVILMSDKTRDQYFNTSEITPTDIGNKALEGVGVGSAVGGAVGAIAGAIAAIGTVLTIPALGVVLAGPLAVGLAGAGAGSIAGGIVGALVGAGIPEEQAKEHEEAIKNGGIVIGIKPNSETDHKIFDRI